MKYFFVVIYFLWASPIYAQLIKVPDLVKETFDKQYPEAKSVDWKGGLDNHIVTFKLGEKQYRASYTKNGSWNYTETSIEQDRLPKSVQLSFGNSKYNTWKVKECIVIKKPKTEASEYKILVQKSALVKKWLMFDARGRLYEELPAL